MWKIAIVKDTSKKMFGLHGLQTAPLGLPDTEVVAQVDPNFDGIADRMKITGAKRHYTDLETMLKSERPDIVILTSRHPGDHLEQIRLCAAYHAHIYCEKPLVADLEQGDEILRLVKDSGIKFCMAHPCRYAEPYLTMTQMIANGEIGQVISFTARGKCDHRGGGEDLIVLGTHILDWLIQLFGAPQTVMADITKEGKPLEYGMVHQAKEAVDPVAGDHIYAVFRFANGIVGNFESASNLYTRAGGNSFMGLTVMGTKGSLSVRFEDGYERELLICRAPVPPESGAEFEVVPTNESREIPGAEPLDYERCMIKDCPKLKYFPQSNRFAIYDLMQAIKEDREPVSSAYNAILTQEMIQGIYLSHLTGRKISFPLTERQHPLTHNAAGFPAINITDTP